MHGVHVHLGKQRGRSSDYQRNEDITGLVQLTYVAGPDKPCDVGGEVRPPKVVNDVCSCGKVSMMSGSIVSGGENCWSFVAVDDYFMTALWIPFPKMAIYLEEDSVYCKKAAYVVLVSPGGHSVVSNHLQTWHKWLSA